MDLTKVFSAVSGGIIRKETKSESYLAVKVSTGGVAACVWTVTGGTVAVGKVGSGEISGEGFDGLLKASDKAVSLATEGLTEEVNRVVFALPFRWVLEGKVLPEKLTELRRLCKELDLSPLGYVSLTEALENYFKETEGAPLTAILVGIDGSGSVLSMYRAGKDLGTIALEMDEKSEDISLAIEKALKQFNEAEVLPSRIILYDGQGDLESVAKKITAYPWTQRAAFLHFPKVEVLASEKVARAVAVAGGMQLGGHFDEQDIREKETVNSPEDIRPIENEETREGKGEELTEVSAEEAGFVTEAGEMGVAVPLPKIVEETEKVPTEAVVAPKKIEIGRVMNKVLLKLKQIRLPKFSMGGKNNTRLGLLAAVIAVIILGSLLIAGYILPKAFISITVASQPFDKQMDLKVGTGQESSGLTLAGTVVSVTEVGTKKGVTTGSKLVGNKAHGAVTIYGVSNAQTFPAGTVFISPEGLKFTLDGDANVASGDAVTPATVSVNVTAADIGDNYNLPAGTKFSVGKFSSSEYLAKNDSAFSGGNSHQATVVTKADQDRLMATLSAELTEQAGGDLQNKLEFGQKLLPKAVTATVEKKKFSADVDSEAETVSLDLTMSFQGIVFSEDEVLTAFKNNFASDIPQGYDLNKESAKVEVVGAKTDNSGVTTLSIHVDANLRPKLDAGQITSEISGKSWSQASGKITKMTGVTGATLTVKPAVFSPLVNLFLPWRKGGIDVRLY